MSPCFLLPSVIKEEEREGEALKERIKGSPPKSTELLVAMADV
jgi:hypothetical protein